MIFLMAFFSFINLSLFSGDIVIKALKDELNASYNKLKDVKDAPVYFMGYELWKEENYVLSSKLGSIDSENSMNYAILTCDMRIGNKNLDSTHEIKSKANQYSNSTALDISYVPLNDYDALRVNIWNLTDKVYKKTLDRYLKVLTDEKITASGEDKSGDFISYDRAEVFYSTVSKENFDIQQIKNLINEVSIIAKNYDFLLKSEVSFSAKNSTRYLVNTEGSEIVEGSRKYRIIYEVLARTDDGIDLSRSRSYFFASIKDMVDKKTLINDFRNSIKELKELIDAKELQPYHGPAIIENKAAAVFWHEIFGHRIEGHRQKKESEGQTFTKKLGTKIMPDFITIYDDPDLSYYGGKFLNGHYLYDDEGIKSQRVILVENGILKGFLMNRTPIAGFYMSNGHGRRSYGYSTVARQGNLIVEVKNPLSFKQLKNMLIDEIKKTNREYGIIIKDIEGGYTYTTRDLPQSYTILIKYASKIYRDGREEVVKGLNLIGTPLNTFPKIIAGSDDYDVFNGVCGAESGWVDVSAVSPSLLFSEIETEKVKKELKKPPVLKAPFFDKK